MCECSASTCLAAFSSLNSEFLEMNLCANGSNSCCKTSAIREIALDASFVIYDLKSVD